MVSSEAPGVNTAATPSSFRAGMSPSGMIPPTMTSTSSRPCWPQAVDHPGHEGQMGARQQRQPHGVGVLLDDRLDHLLGGLVQPGVDHLEAGVAKARAMTLAPRSWPSSPGLATTTR